MASYCDSRILSSVNRVLSCYPTLPSRLKDKQLEVLQSVLEGNDTFAVLPTGYGKSLIYYLLPLVQNDLHPTAADSPALVVVSPLTQLIESQMQTLRNLGLGCLSLSATMIPDGKLENKVSHLFTSPEAILCSGWRDKIQSSVVSEGIVAAVIDEVHCVTEW